MKTQKRSVPKEPVTCILDEDTLQIALPHVTKSFKNLGTLPYGSSKNERALPQGNLISMRQINPSSSQQILNTCSGDQVDDPIGSFTQIPTRQKVQKSERKQPTVMKVDDKPKATQLEQSLEQPSKQSIV